MQTWNVHADILIIWKSYLVIPIVKYSCKKCLVVFFFIIYFVLLVLLLNELLPNLSISLAF